MPASCAGLSAEFSKTGYRDSTLIPGKSAWGGPSGHLTMDGETGFSQPHISARRLLEYIRGTAPLVQPEQILKPRSDAFDR
jgi:hypothetical protein